VDSLAFIERRTFMNEKEKPTVDSSSAGFGPLAQIIPGIPVCGIRLNPYDWDEISQRIFRPDRNERLTLGCVNVHTIFLAHRTPRLREYFRSLATFTHVDGAPIILFAKLRGAKVDRHNQTAWMTKYELFLDQARDAKQRIYYLGSKPGVAARMAEIERERHPGLIMETADGYFNRDNPAENQAVIDKINAWNPDILLIGMGAPLQEIWVLDNRDKINARVTATLGATADYVAGEIPTVPAWMERFYLLGVFRLFSEPRRLWPRYIVEPWYAIYWFFRCGGKVRED